MTSASKRTLPRLADAPAASPTPASKRQKTAANSHVPTQNGLGFLVDEDARAGKKLTAHLTNGVPRSKAVRVDESAAVVRTQPNTDGEDLPQDHISISSGASESSEYDSDADQDMDINTSSMGLEALANGHAVGKQTSAAAEDEEMEDAPAREENGIGADADGDDQDEPTFGDMLRARHVQPIDVRASLPDLTEQSAVAPASSYTALGIPASTSLFTFLTQSLKTNDQEQLERCFQVKDLNSVRATIQRLQSHLVATLLKRIAERIHKRPGRMAQLMIWVQWSLVTHGGYLASQPDVMKHLRALSQVVRERAAGLQPLLHVKGKLDMLASQLVARKAVQAASRGLRADEDDDEEAVTYVEDRDGDDDSSGDEARRSDVKMIKPRRSRSQRTSDTKATGLADSDESDEDEDEKEEEAMTNGVAHESDDDDEEDEEGSEADGKANGMFDMEAEETSDDEADEEADEESDEDEDSDAESEPSELSEEDADLSDTTAVKQAPLKTLNRVLFFLWGNGILFFMKANACNVEVCDDILARGFSSRRVSFLLPWQQHRACKSTLPGKPLRQRSIVGSEELSYGSQRTTGCVDGASAHHRRQSPPSANKQQPRLLLPVLHPDVISRRH
nr:u3 small nucleolar rna-associated protein 5 [Quercus suber]